MRSVLIYLVASVNLISLIHLGFYVVGANAYDITQLRKARGKRTKEATSSRLKKSSGRKSYPLVSVIIPAHNEEVGVKRTLDSVRASTYPNVEIIVVDDGSKDDTAKVTRDYIKNLPQIQTETYMARGSRGDTGLKRRYVHRQKNNQRIVLVSQKNQGKGAAVNNGIANYAKGQFVMTLDADSMLRPEAIENAIAHFRDNKVLGVAANVRVMGDNSWLSLLQRFEHMIGYRSKKFYSLTGTEFIIGGVASTYRRSTLKQVGLYDTDTLTEDIGLSLKIIAKKGNRQKCIIYAADVVAMTEGVQTYRQLLRQRYRWKMGMLQNLYKYRSLLMHDNEKKYTWGLTVYRLPMAILSELMLFLSPIALGYIVYVSIAYHTLSILFGAYLTITAYILWNVWPDEYYTLSQKLRMSVFSIFMYVVFYSMDLVQIVAIIRCIKNYKSVVHGVQGHATWVSPTRSGKQAVAA